MARGDFPFHRHGITLRSMVARPRLRAELGVPLDDRGPGRPTCRSKRQLALNSRLRWLLLVNAPISAAAAMIISLSQSGTSAGQSDALRRLKIGVRNRVAQNFLSLRRRHPGLPLADRDAGSRRLCAERGRRLFALF